MTSRSVPSYSPIARARLTALSLAQHGWHTAIRPRDWGLEIGDWSCRASGSPHLSHSGGVIRRTIRQQLSQTQPDNGSSKRASQTGQAGANSADTSALIPLGISDWGFGISSITAVARLRLVSVEAHSQRLDETVQHLADWFNQDNALRKQCRRYQLPAMNQLEESFDLTMGTQREG